MRADIRCASHTVRSSSLQGDNDAQHMSRTRHEMLAPDVRKQSTATAARETSRRGGASLRPNGRRGRPSTAPAMRGRRVEPVPRLMMRYQNRQRGVKWKILDGHLMESGSHRRGNQTPHTASKVGNPRTTKNKQRAHVRVPCGRRGRAAVCVAVGRAGASVERGLCAFNNEAIQM